jgi:hypothetical protein
MNSSILNNDKLEFRTIVLQFIHNITNLSLNFSVSDVDKIIAMNDAVLCLSDVLVSFYDDEMKKSYSNYEDCVKILRKKQYVIEGNYQVRRFDYLKFKQITRYLFRELNSLLGRVDYLKSAVYGEDKDELVSDEDESEGSVE